MLGMSGDSVERRRKERERLIIQEGTELWKRRKLREEQEWRADQKKALAMLKDYHPWGKPGGGAPNKEVRRKPLTLTQLDTKRGLEATLPRCGPRPPILRRSDPLLRYQFHEPVRRSIDNHVRYRRPYQEQQQYRQQLDRLVAEKQRQLAEERRDDKLLCKMTGWTDEPTFQRMEYQHMVQDKQRAQTPRYPMLTDAPGREAARRREIHPLEEAMTGGVELVPLLARRRVGYRLKELNSTDVTRRTNGGPPLKPVWRPAANEQDYLKELTTQIVNKEIKIKEERTDDIVRCRRHFETWGGLWGRPGHGAPKATNAKENLDNLLYHMPVATM